VARFPFSFRSKVSDNPRLDLALATNFDKAATEDYVDAAITAIGPGVSDHGLLTGLADDDHTQYHNDARGDARYWQLSTDLATQAELDAHINDASDAHDASAISILDTANDFTATDVEGALAELQSDHETDAQNLSDHIADTTAAHAASAISNTPAGNIAATDVQAALNELDTDKATTGSVSTVASDLSNHISDASDAHDASAISVADAGGLLAATDVEGALAEIAGEVDTNTTAISNHLSDATDAHDASAISIVDAGAYFTGTDVEAALQEAGADIAALSAGSGIPGSTFDAKGDLLVGTADDTYTRRAVPSDLWVPVADSSQSDGWRNELPATRQALDDLRDEFDGHHHDDRYRQQPWSTLFQAGGAQAAGAGAGTYLLGSDDAGGNLTGTGTGTGPVLYWDPSNHSISGRTAQFRLVANVNNNTGADSGVTFTFALVPITAIAGAAGTISYTTGSAALTSSALNPAVSSSAGETGSAVAAPAASGIYVLVYTTSGTMAASSYVRLDARVEVRHN
jgi:hypothetical protein